MLIDATHAEETRVVVVNEKKLEEFDFETSTKKQLKGNIYLAKITRVEPSLQAAFVDYGGIRDGFLPFSEIHPDYYQIPIADRAALLEQERAREASVQSEEEVEPVEASVDEADEVEEDEAFDAVEPESDEPDAAEAFAEPDASDEIEAEAEAEVVSVDEDTPQPAQVEDVGGDDFDEDDRAARRRHRNYKIQEVIKRRQIILIQVVKEERGNKGAALTTYISLAGRYCVLMPNTARGGGISRKIVSASDRKRLKDMVGALDVPEGMGVIIRTAGMNRNKPEIKRDFEYLHRLWDEIRETTLRSTAPALVYEEANLIKRSIRDLYSKEIDEVLVQGDTGYKAAKGFMKTLMPSHAKVVQPYKADIPLFHKYGIEEQFSVLHNTDVHLRSGGYIVINPTEALVAIDVNSGRSTRERSIEDTAVATNLEAAEEIARQLKLRDLSGLIVIDFIDMEANRNNRQVERRLKECLKSDRARLQVGRISAFGLLEMSRQRLRPSIIEASSQPCKACGGTGHVRSTESTALSVLRALEDEGLRRPSGTVAVQVASAIALYLLNYKRSAISEIETRYEMTVFLHGNEDLIPPEFRIERKGEEGEEKEPQKARGRGRSKPMAEPAAETADGEEEAPKKRRRGGRRRKKDQDEREPQVALDAEDTETAEEIAPAETEGQDTESEVEGDRAGRKRRRRGKRGGRRRARGGSAEETAESADGADQSQVEPTAGDQADTEDQPVEAVPASPEPAEIDESEVDAPAVQESEPEPEPEPATVEDASDISEPEIELPFPMAAAGGEEEPVPLVDGDAQAQEPRRGWWRRPFG
jgi:ribonuclease E